MKKLAGVIIAASLLSVQAVAEEPREAVPSSDRRYAWIYLSVPMGLGYHPTSDSHQFHWVPVQIGIVPWNNEKTGRFAFGKLAAAALVGFTPGEKMDGHLGLVLSPVLLKLVRTESTCHYTFEQALTFDVGYDVFNAGLVFSLGVLAL